MIAEISGAVVAFCQVFTLLLAIFIAWQANRIHSKTDELVVHTNSLTDKLMAKTDSVARAEGIREGQSNPLEPRVTQQALADLMAQAVVAAATLAADKVLAEAKIARELKATP
jgi:hypothetical protein